MKETKESEEARRDTRICATLCPTRPSAKGEQRMAVDVSSGGTRRIFSIMRAYLECMHIREPFAAFEMTASKEALLFLDARFLALPPEDVCAPLISDDQQQREYIKASPISSLDAQYIAIRTFRIERTSLGGMRMVGEGEYESFTLVTYRLIAVVTNVLSPITERESAIGDMDALLYSHEERRKV